MRLGRLIGIARIAILAVIIGVVAIGLARAQTPPAGTIADRAAFFDKLAREKSTASIEKLARDTLTSTSDASQPFKLEALFERYFELDPPAAVKFANELPGAPIDIVQSIYARLARSDQNAALAALSVIDDANIAQLVAVTIVRSLPNNVASIDLVAAAMHAGNVEQFRSEVLLSSASIPPQEAFAAALRLRDPQRRDSTAQLVIARWAQKSPEEAMAAVARLPDPTLRSSLKSSVLAAWQDGRSLVAYLRSLDEAERRAALESGLLARLSRTEPELAADFAKSLPPGPARQGAFVQIAFGYAQKDATAALNWARGLDPQQPEVLETVLQGIAMRDPLRAFDVVASLPESLRMHAYFAAIGGAHDASQFEQMAARVLGLQDGQTKSSLIASLMNNWASSTRDPRPALEWLLTHAAAVPPETFTGLGYSLAQSDPDTASAYLDRVPGAARGSWIGAIASTYMRSDPQRALAFIDRFRGDPGYDGAASMVVQQLASSDPPAAARLLASIGTRPNGFGPEFAIAIEWARRDPQAAAQWVLDLPLVQSRALLQMVAQTWGQSNPNAVRSWALAAPAGDKRDLALAAALRAQGPGAPDPALMAAFSDDRQRQVGAMNAIIQTASTDAALARQLIGQYVTDTRMRAQAEQLVDDVAHGRVQLPTGPIGGVRDPVTSRTLPPGAIGAPVFGASGNRVFGPGSPPSGFDLGPPAAPNADRQ